MADTAFWEELAQELAGRDGTLTERLREVQSAAEALRARATDAVEVFRRAVLERGASHLANIEVSPVLPDEKHVDCVSFRVERGRYVLLCVGIAGPKSKFRLVGPFKRGKEEGPCADHALRGPELDAALDAGIGALIREASVA